MYGIKTFMYPTERAISLDPPSHAEATDHACPCPRQLRILTREYTAPYVRLLGVCDFHGQEVFWFADFEGRSEGIHGTDPADGT